MVPVAPWVHTPNSISIGLAVFAGLTFVTNRQTDKHTHRQTMLLRRNNRLHSHAMYAIKPNNTGQKSQILHTINALVPLVRKYVDKTSSISLKDYSSWLTCSVDIQSLQQNTSMQQTDGPQQLTMHMCFMHHVKKSIISPTCMFYKN